MIAPMTRTIRVRSLRRKAAGDEGKTSTAPAAHQFPLRLAAIDIGSNALRLLVGEFHDENGYDVLAKHRVPVRLGHNVFQTGKLTGPAMDAAIDALAMFKEEIASVGVHRIRAVATSAVRVSRNGDRFRQRALKEVGIPIEAISGSEEARLVHRAASSRIAFDREPWVLADLGGGSLEVALVNDEGVLVMESHTIGTVRLLEDLEREDRDRAAFLSLLDDHLGALEIPALTDHRTPRGVIITGGNAEALADLAAAPRDKAGVSTLNVKDLRKAIKDLTRHSIDDRIERLGLREDRADVILPAAMVYHRLASIIGTDVLYVPHVGVKEGLLFEQLDRLMANEHGPETRHRQGHSSALDLGRRYHFDERHGVQVARLATELFDQLAPLHGLPVKDRRILDAAAIMHDVGHYFSHKRHHKHSHYLIGQAELRGFNSEEVRLIALVARYHRKAWPKPRHAAFGRLNPKGQDRVTRLAAILRIADALDRGHKARVRSVQVKIKRNKVEITVEGKGDLLVEVRALEKKAALFESTFETRLDALVKGRSQVVMKNG